MGKGGQTLNTEIKALPSDRTKLKDDVSKTFFRRDEVRKHDKKNDLWIIVNDQVYDVTEFLNKHPGGSRILRSYGGQDASEVFNAFHKEFDKVNRYSRMYLIGHLEPNETSTSTNNTLSTLNKENLNDTEKIRRQNQIRSDFSQLRKLAFDMGLFTPSYTFFLLNAMHIIFFQVLGFFILLKYGSSIIPLVCALTCHIVAQAQSAWTQHDYGHSSILSKPKHNQYIQMFFLGIIKGASAEWWTYMHNQHHAKPNVIDIDPDVRLSPVFVLGNTDPKKRAEKNATGKEKFIFNYAFQQYYFPFVAPLLFPIFFQITTIRYAITKKRYQDMATIILMFTIQFGLTYPVFGSIYKALLYFLVVRCFESSWFAWVSQSNHIPMDVHDDDPYDSWLDLQLKGTCNLEKSSFNDWFTGHLNFQIEHHLFPTMPRHNYYKIQPMVQSLCKKHNVNYVIKPMSTAFLDILCSLKKSGEMWQEAYNEFKM